MKTLTASTNGTLSVDRENGSISDRVLLYHNIGRSCAAYAVFYGAMAGQELIRLQQKVGNKKFKPTLESSMSWLSRSTAYLYIGYAKKFKARLELVCPTVGHIDLKSLPDPRDVEATEKTDLFAKVKELTHVNGAEQMWMALGLVKESKPRGGKRVSGGGKKKLTAEEIVYQEAQISFLPIQKALFELDHDKKAKVRLLHLPLEAPIEEASLTKMEETLTHWRDLVKEAIRQVKKGGAK